MQWASSSFRELRSPQPPGSNGHSRPGVVPCGGSGVHPAACSVLRKGHLCSGKWRLAPAAGTAYPDLYLLAASVRADGMLLAVGHHLSDLTTGVPRPLMPERFCTSDEITGLLNHSWTVEVSEARPPAGEHPDGVEVTIHDAILAATPRPVTGPRRDTRQARQIDPICASQPVSAQRPPTAPRLVCVRVRHSYLTTQRDRHQALIRRHHTGPGENIGKALAGTSQGGQGGKPRAAPGFGATRPSVARVYSCLPGGV